MMQQQRKYVRVPFTGRVDLVTEMPPVEVQISNVSMGGLHLYAEKPMDLGDRLSLQICGDHAGKPFQERVNGRVVVVHRRSDGRSYGVQFVPDLHSELQPGLYGWIDQNSNGGGASFLRNIRSSPGG